MKQAKQFLSLLFISFLLACGSQQTIVKNKEQDAKFKFKKDSSKAYFTILQLNDVYEIAPIQGGKYGGMARVETVHQQLLKENENTLLVMAGDFLNPSLLGTIKVNGERVRGKQMVEVMNAMNFDVAAFGNHEFDLSYTNLQDRINESKFDWISANVLHNRKGKHHHFHKIIRSKKENLNDSYSKEFILKNGKRVKVGFISVCIPSNPKSYVHYGNMFEEIQRAYDEIKAKVDIVVGLTHVTLATDKKIAEMLPNIPLIMGGHEHTHKNEKIGNTLITKADANAKTVYIHRFEFDPISKKVTLKSQLKEVNNSIEEDKKIAAIVNRWQQVLQTKIKEIIPISNEVIFTAKQPLEARDTPTRSIQTNMGYLITKAMSYAYNDEVDCALVNGGSIRLDDVLLGDITPVDIFRVLPYGGEVVKVAIKGDLLEEVLEYGLNATGSGAYLQHYNVQKIGAEWLLQNKPIDATRVYKVAFSDYLLKGIDIPALSHTAKGVLDVYRPTATEISFDIRKAIITYLKSIN